MGHGQHHPHDGANLHHIHQHLLEMAKVIAEVHKTLAVMRASMERIEKSAGATQAGAEEILKNMARSEQEWNDALDGLETAITNAVQQESDQIKAEIQRLKDANPALSAQFDRVIQMQTNFADKIGKVWEAEAPSEPPSEPPTDPAARRR